MDVVCYDAKGNAVSVPLESIRYAPAAYGILIDQQQVALLIDEETGLWYPPGGILTSRETPIHAVLIHFRRVSGINPVVGPLLYVEDQYRVDVDGEAWLLSVLYYALERPVLRSAIRTEIADNSHLHLVELDEIERKRFLFGYHAVQAGRLRLALRAE